MGLERFTHEPLSDEVGDYAWAEREGDIDRYTATRTSEGVVIQGGHDEFYKEINYSERTETGLAVRATSPETIKRLGRAVALADLDRYEEEGARVVLEYGNDALDYEE